MLCCRQALIKNSKKVTPAPNNVIEISEVGNTATAITMSSKGLVGGVEGGATHSKLMLFDAATMKEAAEVEGPSSNLYVIGMEETCNRLKKMVADALEKAGAPAATKLKSLGLSLSGCEREETNEELIKCMQRMHPDLADGYAAVSDTRGTLATASDSGGIVLIAGTGSNALLINPDGSTARCGGHGHLLGDEAAAAWIAFRACKIYFDHTDKKIVSDLPVDVLESAIFSHFNITDRFGLYEHCYDKFDKAFFAGLCKRLAEAAAGGDKLCQRLFSEGGSEMALHLVAMSDSIAPELANAPEGLPIVCIGSVWKSWRFMEPGFMATLRERNAGRLKAIRLLQLSVPMPVGACYLGAKAAGVDVPKNYADNTKTFFEATL